MYHTDYPLQFPILKRNRWDLIFGILYLLFITIYIGGLILGLNNSDLFFQITQVILFVGLIPLVIINHFKRKYAIVGSIILKEECIRVIVKDKETVFHFNEITHLKVTYHGFEGSVKPVWKWSLNFLVAYAGEDDGGSNSIEFSLKGEIHRYMFLIKNFSQANLLNRRVDEWKANAGME